MRPLIVSFAWWRSLLVFVLAIQVGWSFWRASRRARRLEGEARAQFMSQVYRREGARLRRASLRLAGLIIKVGQFLSTRVDVLPSEFVAELAELQDLVPPEPWPKVRARLAEAYGRWPIPELVDVETVPVAAASLAQVHRGRLAAAAAVGEERRRQGQGQGQEAGQAQGQGQGQAQGQGQGQGQSPGQAQGPVVAIKVWRPGIERLVDTDLGSLRTVTRFIARHTAWGRRFDLDALFAEFESTTREELDAFHEAERAVQFRRNQRTAPGIGAPRVYRRLTRPGVLVMEFIEGDRVDAPGALERAGLTGPAVADRLTHNYLKQLLTDGLFHADPHPGNLLLKPDGTLVFVDFGMMGHLGPEDRAGVADLLKALFTQDWRGVADAFVRLDFLRPEADLREIRETMRTLIEPAVESALLSRRIDIFRMLRQIETALYELPVQIPSRFAYLGRSLGMVMGLAVRLNPDEPFEQQFRRAVEDMVLGRRAVATAMARARAAREGARMARPAPGGDGGDAREEALGAVGADGLGDAGSGGASDEAGDDRGGGSRRGAPGADDAADSTDGLEIRLDRLVLEAGRRAYAALSAWSNLPRRLEQALSELSSGERERSRAAADLAERLLGLRRSVERAGWFTLAGLAWLGGAMYRLSAGGAPSFQTEWPVYASWLVAALALVLGLVTGRSRER